MKKKELIVCASLLYYKVNTDTSLTFETNAGNFNSNFLTFSSITKK